MKRPRKDDEGLNQPTLIENIMENFQQRATSLNARYDKYKNDPAAAKGEKCNKSVMHTVWCYKGNWSWFM